MKFDWKPYGDRGLTCRQDGYTIYLVLEPWHCWEWHRVSDDPKVTYPEWLCGAKHRDDAVADCENQLRIEQDLPDYYRQAKEEVDAAGWDWSEVEAALEYCLTPMTKSLVLCDVGQMASEAAYKKSRGEAMSDVHRRMGIRNWNQQTIN